MLDVDGIDVFYGPVQALRSTSLHVGTAEMVALVGTNGAGKTTTLRTVSGLQAPSRGEIRLDGERIDGLPAWEVVDRGIAHLPEGRELFADLSVVDNLRLGNWARRRDRAFKAQVDVVMDHFPILRERSGQAAGTLSGGEQQMLGVARALMSKPRLLVVDELSLGLAPKIVEQLFAILRQVNAEGMSVLLVEQFVHMALGNTDRAYVLAKGEVVLDGDSNELLASPDLMAAYLGEAAATGTAQSSPEPDRGAGAGRTGATEPATANATRQAPENGRATGSAAAPQPSPDPQLSPASLAEPQQEPSPEPMTRPEPVVDAEPAEETKPLPVVEPDPETAVEPTDHEPAGEPEPAADVTPGRKPARGSIRVRLRR